MTGGRETGEGGFALLETVIAFVILSIALGVGMQTISQSARVFVRAGDMDRAGQIVNGLAVSRIPQIREAGTLESDARDDGAWRIVAEPVPDTHGRPLLAVTVMVWPRGGDGPLYTYYSLASGDPES